jgi:hypothetical protein
VGQFEYANFQFLTSNTGNPHLDKQISTVTTLMRIAHDKAEFQDMFDWAFSPQYQEKMPLIVDVEPQKSLAAT